MTSVQESAVRAVEASELHEGVAYAYDGSLEGLLTAIFRAYERHEDPEDVAPEERLQPRLGQRVSRIETDDGCAQRVARGLEERCGWQAFDAVRRASLSERPDAGTAAYRFVRYALDEQKRRDCMRCRKRDSCAGARGKGRCPRQAGRALSDLTHPAVAPIHRILLSVRNECEHLRQFVRFEHLEGDDGGFWFARCSPKSSCVPLVMGHFVERFSVQPFVLYDEAHRIAGVYDGKGWHLVRPDEGSALQLPAQAPEEPLMQDAWRRFYRAVSVEARYNPELRRHFMPKRFWGELTELQPLSCELPSSSQLPPGAEGVRAQLTEAHAGPAKAGMKLSEAASPLCQ